MSWTGIPCRFTIQNLLKITIFKIMALHGTLVWLWKLVHLLNLVCSFQWCVLFTDVSDQTLAEQLNRDKDYYAAHGKVWRLNCGHKSSKCVSTHFWSASLIILHKAFSWEILICASNTLDPESCLTMANKPAANSKREEQCKLLMGKAEKLKSAGKSGEALESIEEIIKMKPSYSTKVTKLIWPACYAGPLCESHKSWIK